MNISEISNAILKLAKAPNLVKQMGESGYQRLMYRYKNEYMIETYRKIYKVLFDLNNSILK